MRIKVQVISLIEESKYKCPYHGCVYSKNYFMHFMRNPETNGDANSHPVKMKGGKYGFNP
jgi:hypothetical protein